MENVGEGERIQSDDVQNQPTPQDPDFSSHYNENDISRRQQLIMHQRQRRGYMTEGQRQSYLAQRRTSYQRRRMELPSSNSIPNQNLQRNQWRLSQRNRRQSMGEEARRELLARRRANYRTTRHRSPTSQISNDLPFAESNTYTSENVRQICRTNPIPYNALTSNFEPGSTSARQQPSDCQNQGTHFNENNVITNIQRYPRPRRYRNLARNFGESEVHYRWQLSDPRICIHCQALLFNGETSQFCCRNGNTNLYHIPSPIELQELYALDNEEGRHFRQFIRAYNHVFSFTSMGVNIDESLATGTSGIYTFRAHGSIYHSIGSLLPNDNCRPRYMQMWIVDTDHDIDNRLQENPELKRELLIKIQNILDQHNPFVHVFRQIGQCEDIPNCRLIIRQQKPNEHQYSLPTTSQVAAVIVDNECEQNFNSRDIIIQGIGGNLISIQDVVGYYDPLQYPLLLPHGTYGWDINSRNIDGSRLTCLNYYAYMLQIRENSSSLLLRGGRLFQQYVVDNYVKIETQRLRWIRSNQRDIRSELYQGLQDCLHGGENNAGVQLTTSIRSTQETVCKHYGRKIYCEVFCI